VSYTQGMSRDGCIELARRLGLDADQLLEWWSERAAVREFDGGLPRAAAELAAFDDLRLELDRTSFANGERHGPKRVEPPVTKKSDRKRS
jgi:hypothetical protein